MLPYSSWLLRLADVVDLEIQVPDGKSVRNVPKKLLKKLQNKLQLSCSIVRLALDVGRGSWADDFGNPDIFYSKKIILKIAKRREVNPIPIYIHIYS